MALAGMSDEKRLEYVSSTYDQMKVLANHLRELVADLSPFELLGYIYGNQLLKFLEPKDEIKQEGAIENQSDIVNETQFLLEYVHAVLASTPPRVDASFDEAVGVELFNCARELKTVAMLHAMASSAGTNDGAFGVATGDVEFQIKSNWLMVRGNRYQRLEGEFYSFVLAPHDALFREVYGVSAEEIANGFQEMSNAVLSGHASAIEIIDEQFSAVEAFATERGKPLEEVAHDWGNEHANERGRCELAFDNILRGGICNVSRHTNLPKVLLADLAFERGEETDFFGEGPYSGTPFMTLPARKKPLIKLDEEFYLIDPCFIRDAGYRALLWNLLRRNPTYKKDFEKRQKIMTESAFFEVLDTQLKGSTVYQDFYYKDVTTNQWVENDTLILIDDVLVLVEAKSGAAATIASPALDFQRHIQSIQDLIVKAYKQCVRFFAYLHSNDEVSIFKMLDGKYVKCCALRHSLYRMMLPIGLTVESFSPFSTMCKELPDIAPLLGKYPFISLSIDDLFVLKRLLPTTGELMHYLEVRQVVAGMKGTYIFDEIDHLGAYIARNRFDLELADQLTQDNPHKIVWDGMSEIVDHYFGKNDFEKLPIPTQNFPSEILGLLGALNITRRRGWLAAESCIRSYGEEGRKELAKLLTGFRTTLEIHSSRYFAFIGSHPLFIWLQKVGIPHDPVAMKRKASAAALVAKNSNMIALFVTADPAVDILQQKSLTLKSQRNKPLRICKSLRMQNEC